MSNDFNPYQASAEQSPGKKRGMSSWVIILITVGVLAVVSVLVCCGGMIYLGAQTFSTSPEQVAAVTESIVDIDLSDPWKPFMSFDLTRFGGPMRMAMYVIDVRDKSNMAMVMDMDVPEHELDNDPERFQEQTLEQMDQQMRQQRQSMESLVIKSSEKLKFDVNGETAHAQVSDAEGEKSGRAYHEVIVIFHGKQRPAVLYMRALNDDYSRDDIDRMLRSMKD